jgi:uncharacterized protein
MAWFYNQPFFIMPSITLFRTVLLWPAAGSVAHLLVRRGGLLLLSRFPTLNTWLHPVAAAGRMALTNYLLQIATLDLLFSGYALDLQHVRPVTGFSAALACFAAECLFSTTWLKRFRFGPAEWLWRSFTYGQPQPMRRASPLAA